MIEDYEDKDDVQEDEVDVKAARQKRLALKKKDRAANRPVKIKPLRKNYRRVHIDWDPEWDEDDYEEYYSDEW